MEKLPLPNKIELKETGDNRADLIIEPLFAGFGLTIGNALRRVLLSSIPGAAVTSLKIKGVDHEFSTLDGVKEDVVDIILNFKKLRMKIHTDEDVRLELKTKGKKAVTAGDISPNADVEIMNPDLVLATLTDDKTELEIEIIANRGRGYTPKEARGEEKKEIGMITVDSVYTPVVNVGMKVENVRVGQVTNFERVTLDVQTDGIVSPKEAAAYAAQILVDHFSLLVESDLEPQTERIEPEAEAEEAGEEAAEGEEEFTGAGEVEAPAPKKRGRPKKQPETEEEEA